MSYEIDDYRRPRYFNDYGPNGGFEIEPEPQSLSVAAFRNVSITNCLTQGRPTRKRNRWGMARGHRTAYSVNRVGISSLNRLRKPVRVRAKVLIHKGGKP